MMKENKDINWVLKNFWDFFQTYVVHKEQFIAHFNEYNGSAGDFVWSIFQLLLTKVAEASQQGVISEELFYKKNKEIYFQMALFLRRHENKRGNHVFKLSLYNALLYNKISSTLKRNVVIISGDCCPFCDNLNNQEISFEEALKEQYLGSDSCTRKYGCNCTYAYRLLRDSNGVLIGND